MRLSIPFREFKEYSELSADALIGKIYFDIPGYISNAMMVKAIENNHIIKQGNFLNSLKTKIDADNYYIHANDFIF